MQQSLPGPQHSEAVAGDAILPQASQIEAAPAQIWSQVRTGFKHNVDGFSSWWLQMSAERHKSDKGSSNDINQDQNHQDPCLERRCCRYLHSCAEQGTFRKVLMRKLGLRPCAVCDARSRLATSLTDTSTETCLQGTTSYEVASSSLRMLFPRLTWDRAAAARLYMTYSSRHCFLRRLYVLHTSLSVNRESVIWHLATSCTGILQCWYSYGSQDTYRFQFQDTS